VDLARAAAWHRQVAALAAAADRAGVAADQLPALQARLEAQRAGLAQAAERVRSPLPALTPTPTEIAAAGAGFGDLSEAAVTQAIRSANQTLDAADRELTGGRPASQRQPTPPPVESLTRVAVRNGLVYGGFAASVLIIQIVLFIAADEASTLPTLAPVCLVGLPAFAWLGGWLTIGAAFRPAAGGRPPAEGGPPAGGKVNRTPRLGVAICLMPNALLCAALGVLFVAR
jgi:hypothetical protein